MPAIAPWMCLACGYAMDHATSPTNPKAKPKPGDVSLCLNCTALYQCSAEGAWKPRTLEGLPAEIVRRIELYRAAQRRANLGNLAHKWGGRA